MIVITEMRASRRGARARVGGARGPARRLECDRLVTRLTVDAWILGATATYVHKDNYGT